MPTPPPPFDLDILRTFVAIVDAGGFTRAAGRVGLTQSSVSLQIRKLERGLGKPVFSRESRDVRLTVEGEILLGYARQVLRMTDEVRSRLMEEEVAGTVRLGTPEDFATVHLPEVLARFARAYPRVSLEVNCDFTVNLLDGFSRGLYDLILFKREAQAAAEGPMVWREVLEWVGSPRVVVGEGEAIPLVLAPAPDVYRKRALAALEAEGRPWRVAFTSPSLAGLQAAVVAGLGITVLPRGMVAEGMRLVGPDLGLPSLPDTEIVLRRARGALSRAADLLSEHIVQSLARENETRPVRAAAPGP